MDHLSFSASSELLCLSLEREQGLLGIDSQASRADRALDKEADRMMLAGEGPPLAALRLLKTVTISE